MKEKVMSLAQGKFTYEEPAIVLSTEKLEFEVTEGAEAASAIRVCNAKNTKIKGFGAASELEMEFLPVFDGKENEITVKVHAGNYKAGDVLTGNLVLITDCGEKYLPYEIKVVGRYLEGVTGVIGSYSEFVQYAKEHFDEAVTLFYHEKFKDIYLKELHEKRLYQNLTQKNPKKQALEEFLVAHGDKKPVQFMVNKKQLILEIDNEDYSGGIVVAKDSWGMVGIKVASDKEFVTVDKSYIYENDFKDNQITVAFHIAADQIPSGMHKCHIVLENVYQRLEVTVRIHGMKGAAERAQHRKDGKMIAGLVQTHIQYMMNSSLRSSWLEKLNESRERLLALYPESERLLDGYISYIAKDEKGMEQFEHAVGEIAAPEPGEDMEKVYRYLCFMYVKNRINQSKEEKEELTGQIKKYYENGYHHWRLLVLLERLDYFQGNAAGFLEELDLLWDEGGMSPYIHLYRMLLILQESDLLKQLDARTMGSLRFALKHDLMTEDIVIATSFLAARQKKCTPALLALLEKCYDRFENKDTLHSICALLIRSEKQDTRYFKWFNLGVKKSLRITELFEYYMYTMDKEKMDEALSSVITYFQYENHLRDSVKASFYASIVRNREEHPEYFQVYSNVIREFTLKQLYSHKIYKELAVLYEAFLTKENVKDRVARELPYILFHYQINCNSRSMERVVVMHDEGTGEMTYNLANGEAYINIGTNNYKLYFVDKNGFYHSQDTVPYTLTRILELDELAESCYENGSEHPVLLLNLFSKALEREETEAKDAIILHMMIRNNALGMEYRNKALLALYAYYRSIGEDLLLEEILKELDFKYLSAEKRAGVLQTMIQHKMNDAALEALRKYQITNCSRKLILLLITWKLEENEGRFEPYYMKLCDILFRQGVSNPTTLSYLANYYMGETSHLYEIYKAAGKCETEVTDGAMERLLGQALFVADNLEKYADVFKEYYEYGANRILVKAFLSYTAYQYLVDKCELADGLAEKIKKDGLSEDNHTMILAALKYYSGREEYTEQEKEFIGYHLSRYVSTGKVFAFMKRFSGKVELPFEIENSEIIQFFTSYDGEVYVELEQADGSKSMQPMRQSFTGVYIYETLLFRGERLSYRIYAGDMEKPVCQGVLEKGNQEGEEEKAFYGIVNDMISAREKGDKQKFDELVKRYKFRQQMAEKLFEPL